MNNYRLYLKSCKNKILVFINYNNFYQFIYIKTSVLDKFDKLKSYFLLIFKLIIISKIEY